MLKKTVASMLLASPVKPGTIAPDEIGGTWVTAVL
jgi:hypothetical protein